MQDARKQEITMSRNKLQDLTVHEPDHTQPNISALNGDMVMWP